MASENEQVPRRKRHAQPGPADPEAERKRLLLKIERLALKKVARMVASGVEQDFDFMTGESRRLLELAEDARSLLDGKLLPHRTALESEDV